MSVKRASEGECAIQKCVGGGGSTSGNMPFADSDKRNGAIQGPRGLTSRTSVTRDGRDVRTHHLNSLSELEHGDR